MKINHTMCIPKILTDLCAIKRKIKKKNFCKCCLQFCSSEKILLEHKENFLIINGKQTVKLKSGSVRFKIYLKQSAVPFKIYADFECLLKGDKISDKNNSSYTIKRQDHIPCIIKLFVSIINLVKKLCFIGEKLQFID